MEDNSLSLEWARIICEMEDVCFGEGIGPDSSEILAYIFARYPQLREEFSHLPAALPTKGK